MSKVPAPDRKWVVLRSVLIGAGILALFVALMMASATVTFIQGVQEPLPDEPGVPPPPEVKPGQRVNMLVLGVDEGPDGSATRSDTIIVASFHSDGHCVAMLSLPRDTRVMIPGRGLDKLGHAHAFGGPRLTMQTVEGLLGVPIHYYVRTDLQGFAAIVDLLGGVEVDVPQRMYYVDPYQDLVIDLMPGRQWLDGDKALQFVRFRGYSDADLGRIRAQQAFLSALFDRLFHARTILKLPAIAGQLAQNVETNMSSSEILKYARWAVGLRPDAIMMETLHGVPTDLEEGGHIVSYVIVEPAAVQDAVTRLFEDESPPQPIRVEVYNGSGRSGLARELADRLAAEGYEVVTVANAERMDYPYTMAVVADGAEVSLEALVQTLSGLGVPIRVSDGAGEGPGAGAAVRVVIGSDYPR